MINRTHIEKAGSLLTALVLTLQMGVLPTQAVEPEVTEPPEEGLTVTEAENQAAAPEIYSTGAGNVTHTPENRTIYWADGITPPQFEAVPEHVGSDTYNVYKALFQPGNGWYDLNKHFDNTGNGSDAFLCYAVAASNALHWWMDQNQAEITAFIDAKPDDAKRQALNTLRKSPVNQMDSAVYEQFRSRYSSDSSADGYWTDILIDEFINGYKPKENGSVNDETERDHLLQNGPYSPASGYFYDIFGTIRLSDRRHYYGDYDVFSREVKNLLSSGKIVMMNFATGPLTAHVVTLWGAEYDENGQLKAVYITDSDDTEDKNSAGVPYAMIRYNVKKNAEGLAVISSNPNGVSGSKIDGVQTLSLGTPIWEKRTQERPDDAKIPLKLKWGNTVFNYTGRPVVPNVTATNVEQYDDLGVFFKTVPADAGTYTPDLVLKGISAHRYTIDPDDLQTFTIKQAAPTVSLDVSSQSSGGNQEVTFEVRATGMNGTPLNGTVQLRTTTSITIADNVDLQNGYAQIACNTIPNGTHTIRAVFTPSSEGVSKNYSTRNSNTVRVEISDKKNQTIQIVEIPEKTLNPENPETFELSITGGPGSGEVTYTCDAPDVLSIQGNQATVIGAGRVVITAEKAADEEYNLASDSYTLTVNKAPAPEILFPQAGPLVYGQALSESTLSGGSTQYGSFAWERDLIPQAGTDSYAVQFIPSDASVKNYEGMVSRSHMVSVTVDKAAPSVALQHEVTGSGETRSIVFSTSVPKSGNGDMPTGTVTFIDQDTQSQIAEPVTLVNGAAAYTWSNLPAQLYQIQAQYSGDENYSAAASQTVTIDLREGGGGSGGGGDISGGGGSGGGGGGSAGGDQDTQPEVEKHPDGTTTEIVKNPDGSTTTVVKKPDGSHSTTTTRQDGTSEVKVSLSKPAIEAAQKQDESIPLPMPEVAASQDKASVIHVDTGSKKDILVSVPVKNLSYSTVAVMVNQDGSREVIRKSALSSDGLVFSVPDQATVEILDHSREFVDAKAHWANDAITFVTSHELYGGTSADTFAPDDTMTRGMLVQVLHNLENNPKSSSEQHFSDVSAESWYTEAIQWAAESGIVSGLGDNQFAPERNITRESVAVILYRYAGCPTHTNGQLTFQDADQVSGYASEAVRWAVETGIMNGNDQNCLDPKGTATRAQVASILTHFLNQTIS